MDNVGEAEATFNRLIEKYPGSDEAYKGMFLLGYMYFDVTKDEEKATSLLTSFIEMYPDSELAISAKVLVENIGLPIDDWSIVRNLESDNEK